MSIVSNEKEGVIDIVIAVAECRMYMLTLSRHTLSLRKHVLHLEYQLNCVPHCQSMYNYAF